MADFVYKEGQFVCVLVPSRNNYPPDTWYFAKISKIRPKKSGESEMVAEVYLYGIPETYVVPDDTARWERLYPGARLTRETVMLARLAAKMTPSERDRYSQLVAVRMKDICPAKYDHFFKRLTVRF